MTTQTHTTPVSVRLSPDMRQVIATMAARERRSFHAQVLVLLDVALGHREATQGFERAENGTPGPLVVPAPHACQQVSAG